MSSLTNWGRFPRRNRIISTFSIPSSYCVLPKKNNMFIRTFSKNYIVKNFSDNFFHRNFTFCNTRTLPSIFSHTINRSDTVVVVPVRGKRKESAQSENNSSSNKNNNGNSNGSLSHLFVPVPIQPVVEDVSVGAELTGKLNKQEIVKVLNKFFRRSEIKLLSLEHGLDSNNEYVKIPHHLFHQAFISFRRYCLESENLPVDIHIVFSDIIQGAAHIDDLFIYFIRHAKQIFPHLECMDDLRKISDLRSPANWYPEARGITRKIVFHAGPTNSGKTYHALEKFMAAKSGVYCGPLKLLATEVFNKCNDKGTHCDLITGEERRFAQGEQEPAQHVSCTVEMTSVNKPYEIAVIDEIQMLRDQQRGWAWSRALLGVVADEVHLCGESAAIELVKSIMVTTGEDVQVYKYKRLTDLDIEKRALESLDRVRPGDCIVCFSKNDIYSVSRHIEKKGHEVAVIYGGLPPGTKLAQAKKFNDPENPCKILVATDAIGMGLNLSIRRVIFYSLIKPTLNEKGEREMDTITTSQALQIAGRAGRYGTQFSKGAVTTYRSEDLPTLQRLMAGSPEDLIQAGLHPTADQIEMYAYHLPNATLSNLMDIFVSLSTVDDSLYFMCNVDDFKFLADMIQHVPLPLRARYVFCCAPINRKMPFVCTMFLKFARQYSKNEAITFDWLCRHVGWPFNPPQTILDLVHLESIFDVLDLHLWLSYRFQDLFVDATLVRDTQKELDSIIQMGVFSITKLLKNSESGAVSDDDDDNVFVANRKRRGKPNLLAIAMESSEDVDSDEKPKDSDMELTKKIKGRVVSRKKGGSTVLGSSKSAAAIGKGRLTERLLAQGLITPKILEQLQNEWQQDADDVPSTNKPKK